MPKLSERQYEEILDRISLFSSMCDMYLQQHPVSKINPNVKDSVDEAVNSIIRISEEVKIAYNRIKDEGNNSRKSGI